jgi:hypoxanthine phosphoribosyltransferase
MNNKDIFVVNEYIFKKKIDSSDIRKRVKELALDIRKAYTGKKITYIIVLKGAFVFAADLIREINLPSEILFIDSKSYGQNFKSTGKIVLNLNDININGKNVIIIEDIIDSGKTMKVLLDALHKQKPKSIQIAAFLSKPESREAELFVKYTGYDMSPDFVVGYGLDYAEQGRHLPHIFAKV